MDSNDYIIDILATTSVTKIGGKSMFEKGQCQTDIFSVTTPGNNAPPTICGTNSGEHSEFLLHIRKLMYNILHILISVHGFI